MTKRRLEITRSDVATSTSTARLVSVLSGKGGVGKSVLAYNLAERMAAGGVKVLLVDLDFSCGNQHILANQACRYGVAHVVSGELTMAEAVTPMNEKLGLLAAVGNGWPQSTTAASGAARLAHILRTEAGRYDVVMIDHPSGKSEASVVAAAASDINILLVLPELTSIADACGLYKQLLATDRSLDCRLLINRAESDGEADYIHKKFGALTERFYGRAPGFLGRLLEDSAYRRAVAAQAPLAEVAENSMTIQDLETIAAVLAPRPQQDLARRPGNDRLAINNVTAEADIRG